MCAAYGLMHGWTDARTDKLRCIHRTLPANTGPTKSISLKINIREIISSSGSIILFCFHVNFSEWRHGTMYLPKPIYHRSNCLFWYRCSSLRAFETEHSYRFDTYSEQQCIDVHVVFPLKCPLPILEHLLFLLFLNNNYLELKFLVF